MQMKPILTTIAIFGSALVSGHAQMAQPPSRNLQNPNNAMSAVQKPCGDYQPGPVVATYTAGKTANVKLEGSATHNGGGCVFSLSYDGGNTFTIIQVTDKSCPMVQDFQVPIPASAPACESCIFAWSWVPVSSGAPEYFMGCADVKIKNPQVPAGSPFHGTPLPFLNMPGKETFWTNNADKSATLPWVENVPALISYAPTSSVSLAPAPITTLVKQPKSPMTFQKYSKKMTVSKCRRIGLHRIITKYFDLPLSYSLRRFRQLIKYCDRYSKL